MKVDDEQSSVSKRKRCSIIIQKEKTSENKSEKKNSFLCKYIRYDDVDDNDEFHQFTS